MLASKDRRLRRCKDGRLLKRLRLSTGDFRRMFQKLAKCLSRTFSGKKWKPFRPFSCSPVTPLSTSDSARCTGHHSTVHRSLHMVHRSHTAVHRSLRTVHRSPGNPPVTPYGSPVIRQFIGHSTVHRSPRQFTGHSADHAVATI